MSESEFPPAGSPGSPAAEPASARRLGDRASSRRRRAREARSALYRQLVFEAAERAFAEKGVEDTKMEEIAAEAGLALGTLYNVVAGKARLVAEIHESRLGEATRRARELARSAGDPVETLLQGVRGYVDFFAAHPDYLRMHLQEGYAWGLGTGRGHGPAHAEAWREAHALQVSIFQRGIAQGLFYEGDPHRMARMMVALQQVQLADWVDGGMTRDPAELVAEMQTQARRCFCRPREAS